uniref:putative methyltransferase DDB_G0268948 n=1 Tax=Styela clava TaxID=7725 RepID=UPI00193A7699|nr:putative methyltransferase DDB_G0268948 [Styela clava]
MELLRYYETRNLAKDYDKYRPSYSQEVAEKIMKEVHLQINSSAPFTKLGKMLDVGCGGGQATCLFSPYFESVLGIDISAGQISVAIEKNNEKNVQFQLVNSGKFPLPDNSIEFVNCATAAHWLDITLFESECERVLKRNGCVALYAYLHKEVIDMNTGRMLALEHDYRQAIRVFFKAIYAHPRNRLVEKRYEPIFDQLANPTKRWVENITFVKYDTFHTFRGYFDTIGEYRNTMNNRDTGDKDPLDEMMNRLKEIWELNDKQDNEIQLKVIYEVNTIMFHKE